MAKRYKGNPPDAEKGWEEIGAYVVDGDRWAIYRRQQQHSEEWADYKIAADGVVEGKANYWLARNDATGQIGFSRDYAMMRETRPVLHAAVEYCIADC